MKNKIRLKEKITAASLQSTPSTVAPDNAEDALMSDMNDKKVDGKGADDLTNEDKT